MPRILSLSGLAFYLLFFTNGAVAQQHYVLQHFRIPGHEVPFDVVAVQVDGRRAVVRGKYCGHFPESVYACLAVISMPPGDTLFSQISPIAYIGGIRTDSIVDAAFSSDLSAVVFTVRDSSARQHPVIALGCGESWTSYWMPGTTVLSSVEHSPVFFDADRRLRTVSPKNLLGFQYVFERMRLDNTWKNWTVPVIVDSFQSHSYAGSLNTLVRLHIEVRNAVTNMVVPLALALTESSHSPCKIEYTATPDGVITMLSPSHTKHQIVIDAPGYLPATQIISIREIDSSTTARITVKLIEEHRPLLSLFFERGTSDLTNAHRDSLYLLAFRFNNRDISFVVEGYSDIVGKRKFNEALSDARARAVYESLLPLVKGQVSWQGKGVEMGVRSMIGLEFPASRRVDIFAVPNPFK